MAEIDRPENVFFVGLLIISGALYIWYINSGDTYKNPNEANLTINDAEEDKKMEGRSHKGLKPNSIRTIPKPQPSCPPINKLLEIEQICKELVKKRYSCTPEDVLNPEKHKIPKYYFHHSVKNNSNNETQNIIVNCIIAALLLTSLGAAILEFYRAKMGPTPDGKKGVKTPLNRKCSLADLTVMKHHRKELVRRESILETHAEEKEGDIHHGITTPVLQRRCSFPTNFISNDPTGGSFLSRRNSRKISIVGDRKLSIVHDSITSEESWRRGSVVEDSSPERRHHSRLVHRH